MSRKTLSLLASAALAVPLTSRSAFAVVDGTVSGGEYGAARALQTTATVWGDNFNEMDGLYANFAPATPSLNFALTGNLSDNGWTFFIDAKSGGGVAQVVNGGYNRYGSLGGERTDDWGTDTDGGDGVNPTPGGSSIVSGGFNPEKSIEIGQFGGTYYIHIVDMTLPNDSASINKDVWLNSPSGTGVNGTSVTNTYFRDNGATASGTMEHAFNTSNTLGVSGDGNNVGDASTATTGFEALMDSTLLGYQPGKALRVFAVQGNGSGDYLSNQNLPSLRYANSGDLQGPGGWGGGPLVDVTTEAFLGDSFITLFEPTFTAGGDSKWSTAANWAGNFAPNGVEHDAAFVGAGGAVTLDVNVTVGSLKFNGSAGYTISAPGAQTLTINAGSAAGRIDVGAFSNVINPKLIIASDTRINLGAGSISLGETDNSAGKRITIAGGGTVNLNGPQTNGVGAGIAVDSGTLNVNSDGGSTSVRNQQIFSSGTVNFNVSQHLDQLGVNAGGLVTLAPNAGNSIIVANTLFQGTSGKLNVGDGKLLLKGNNPVGSWNGSAYTDVTGLVASGRGTSNLWDGQGIITSQSNAVGTDYNSIGVAAASDVRPATASATATWAGQTITGTDTLVMYTYGGDANLDGKINILDYVRIDQGLQANLKGWSNGDFNYDGVVNILDYAPIIDSNIGTQGAAFPTGGGLGEGGSGVSAVPEPASISLLALGAIGALRRRRRSI